MSPAGPGRPKGAGQKLTWPAKKGDRSGIGINRLKGLVVHGLTHEGRAQRLRCHHEGESMACVFKRYGDKLVVARLPRLKKRPATAAERKKRRAFAEANA